jgi:hypothetical protein
MSGLVKLTDVSKETTIGNEITVSTSEKLVVYFTERSNVKVCSIHIHWNHPHVVV